APLLHRLLRLGEELPAAVGHVVARARQLLTQAQRMVIFATTLTARAALGQLPVRCVEPRAPAEPQLRAQDVIAIVDAALLRDVDADRWQSQLAQTVDDARAEPDLIDEDLLRLQVGRLVVVCALHATDRVHQVHAAPRLDAR